MAWELRNEKQYYYRSQRVNGKVTRIYLGAGEIAQQAAERDAAAKAIQAQHKAEMTALQGRLSESDQITAEVETGIKLLVEVELMAMGYHEHKGEWRRRREQ